jgi:hypothetical protein
VRSCRLSIPPLAALLALLAASPLAAQEPLQATREDTLGLAPDTVALAIRHLPRPGECAIPGHAVVRNADDLRRLRRFPQCKEAPFPSLAGKTLVGLSIWGDCNSSYRVDAFRSESRREFRVRLRIRYGGCRAMAPRDEWYALPALPPGWSVRITRVHVEDDAPRFSREWTPIRS